MLDFADIFPLRIMLVDDHLMFSQGIAELLKKIAPRSELSLFSSVQKAMIALEKSKYEFLICDLLIPGSNVIEFIAFCRKAYPDLYIIIVSSSMNAGNIKELFADGVHGYLSKAVTYNELKMALEKAYNGERYISSDLSGKMATVFFEERKTRLTRKELVILRTIADGKTVSETAKALSLSTATVMSHRRNIMFKLDLHSAAELVKYTFENNLF